MVTADVLKEQFLLEDLSSSELRRLGEVTEELRLTRGGHVFTEKEDTNGIFLIRSGKIEISKMIPDGWKQTLAVLGKGSFFGELSIVEHRKHEANAIALEDSVLLLIRKEDFEKLENEDLLLATKIMKRLILVLSRNLRNMNEKFLNALVSY